MKCAKLAPQYPTAGGRLRPWAHYAANIALRALGFDSTMAETRELVVGLGAWVFRDRALCIDKEKRGGSLLDFGIVIHVGGG